MLRQTRRASARLRWRRSAWHRKSEVLAVGCGLRLNTRLRDMLRNDATIKLSAKSLSGVEQFARTYTLSLLHRHHRGICDHALEQFGPEGDQIQGLLLP